MAEDNDSSQEKTEEATPRRLEKAREEGQVPRSKELNTAAILLMGTACLMIFGGQLTAAFSEIMVFSFSLPREVIYDTNQMVIYLAEIVMLAAQAVLPILIFLFIAAIAGSIALGGWLIAFKALAPKFNRMDPIKGIGRMFSMKALVEMFKAIAKVSVVLFFAIIILYSQTDALLGLGQQDILPAMEHASTIIGWSFFLLSATMIVIVLVDVPFQIFDHQKNLKMTKQEVKDEFKDTEGKPEVKGRIRQLQREMADRRMMQDVPKADVVITNPTHYSVALRYKPEEGGAPVLLAKGGDEIALKIREIANANDVEIIESPALARSVFYHTEIGHEIPEGLYMAVAQILAYVFQLKQFRRRASTRPFMPNIDIPDDLRRDE